jgi:hypothetical protein
LEEEKATLNSEAEKNRQIIDEKDKTISRLEKKRTPPKA